MKALGKLSVSVMALVLTLALSMGASALRAEDQPKAENPQSGGEKTAAPAAADDDSGYVVEKKDGKTIKYKKKATYDFEGASIDGLYNKPSGSYISNIKDVKGKSIIRIRENFDAEVIDSGRLVK